MRHILFQLILLTIIITSCQQNSDKGEVNSNSSKDSLNSITIQAHSPSKEKILYDSIGQPNLWTEAKKIKNVWTQLEVDDLTMPNEVRISLTTAPDIELLYMKSNAIEASYTILHASKKQGNLCLTTLIETVQNYKNGKLDHVTDHTKLNDTAIWVFHYLDRKLKLGQWKKYEPKNKDTLLIGNYIANE